VDKLLEKYNFNNGYARFVTDLDNPNFKMWVNPFVKEFVKKQDETLYLFPMGTLKEFKLNLMCLMFYYGTFFKGLNCGNNEELRDKFKKIGVRGVIDDNC